MNRPFWSFRSAPSEDICDSIKPLLSAYADGMASPAETRRIDAHLPQCEGCRAALSWMQATHAALASRPVAVPPPGLHSRIALAIALSSRPVAVPPPDLHSRIARAIAASSPTPVSLRPARVFTLRTAYAAAASVTALGIALSYPLWYTPGAGAVHPAQPPVLATRPAPAGKTHLTPKTPVQPLTASNIVKPLHTVIVRKTPPAPAAPLEHVAVNTPPVKLFAAPQNVVIKKVVASRDIAPVEKHSGEKYAPLPVLKTALPKLPEGPKVAKVIREPIHVPVDIQPTKVTPDPIVQTASTQGAGPKASDNPLGPVLVYVKHASHMSLAAINAPAQKSYHEAINGIQEVGSTDHTAVVAGVYSPR